VREMAERESWSVPAPLHVREMAYRPRVAMLHCFGGLMGHDSWGWAAFPTVIGFLGFFGLPR
jgi:hypothetical protein